MNGINGESVARWLAAAQDWVTGNVLVPATLVQAIVAISLIVLAYFLRQPLRQGIEWLVSLGPLNGRASRIRHTLSGLALPIAAIVLLWLAVGLANSLGLPHRVLGVIASLFNAWAVIRLFSGVAGDTALTRFVALVAWTIAALNILGLLEPTVAALDAASFSLGELRVSALTVLKGIAVLGVLLWLAVAASAALEKRIQGIPDLTPSVKVLLVNLSRIILIIVAVVAGISSVGIDLTAFAVFTGALGVGIGFGLQKVVGNFISGIIILLDKSIKPGDVIEVGSTFGRVSSLGARYVSVVTFSGHEYLIPNEDFITTQVVNWSYSDENVRQSADLGIHYKSDVRRAMEICLEAAAETPRILADPPVKCFLVGFGDSSVDLSVSYWINDPMNGTANIRSDLFLRIWDKFHAEGIEIPYPQRDLYIKEAPVQSTAPMQP